MIPLLLVSFFSAAFHWLSNRLTLRGVIFASLMVPLFIFLKGFVSSTLHLVSSTFGSSPSSLVGSVFGVIFSNTTLLQQINSFLSSFANNEYFSCGWFLRLVCFDDWVGLGSWWLDSLLVVWFLRFVWWCFCKVLDFANSSLQGV